MKESEIHDEMDVLLRDSMTAPPPALPTKFAQQVTRHVRSRRLSQGRRRVLRLYTLAAFVVVLVIMRSQEIEWYLIGVSVVATATVGGLIRAWLR